MALDRATFEELFRAHAARVYSIGVRITGDRAIAEDIVQETFVKAYTAADTTVFDDIGAWLGTVARNASLNVVRNRSRTVGLAEEIDADLGDGAAVTGAILADASPATDPERAAASSEAVRAAWELVDGLGSAARSAIVLRYAEDLPIAVIAEALGKSVNATTVLLHRARGSLRAAYATRVFARAGLPEECRGRKDAIVDLVEGRPVSDELRLHMASCSACQQSAEELRGMTRAFAIAPMFMVPAALGAKVAAAVSMAAGATAVTAAAGGVGATIATASTATTASGAAVGTGATAASGAAVGTGATAASGAGLTTGVTAGAGAAASGGILATVGQVAVAGLITVALVGTMALAPGRVGGGGAPATGHPATAVAAAPRLMASTAGRGSTMDGSSVSGVAPSTAVGRPGATATAPPAGAGTITNPVTAPRIMSPPVAATAPPMGPAAPPAGPATTPRQAAPPTTLPTPVPTPNLAANRARWSVGTSCAARVGLFHPGDVLWVSVSRALPGAVIRWVLTGTRAARPAGLRVAGTVTTGSDGTACAAIWTIPARMDAAGVFRLDVAGSRRTIVLKSR